MAEAGLLPELSTAPETTCKDTVSPLDAVAVIGVWLVTICKPGFAKLIVWEALVVATVPVADVAK